MIREPAVSGRFYPGERATLAAEVDRLLASPGAPPAARAGSAAAAQAAIGIVVPHAGYMYSGAVAGEVYAKVALPPRLLLLGPNHTGLGDRRALWPDGAWRTPLGDVPVDAGLARELLAIPGISPDPLAHVREHSLEVQVPFLQRARPDAALAALCLGRLPWPDCAELGEALAEPVREAGALLVASSDLSHFLPAARAREVDRRAVERILALDPEGLHRVVHDEEISMCGVVPTTVMLVAARALGATRAELVRYAHSGEASGDDRRVVGYAGIIVS